MPDDYERIRKDNKKILDDFENWLRKKHLGEDTIQKHITNIDFYINEFLLYEDPIEAKNGVDHVDMFLDYWFIKKAMWASISSIRSNAASLKKFYTFLNEVGLVEDEALKDLKETIKEDMEEWLDTLRRYDDPSITDMEDVWGFKI